MSRELYEGLRKLILAVLPGSGDPQASERAGEVAVQLMKKKHKELHDLGLIPEKRDAWEWEVDAYGILKPKVKRQLENLVKAGKVKKRLALIPSTSRINFSGREAVYRRK